jgi:dTDP-4-dehydrorhamnose 3,5-epimerase
LPPHEHEKHVYCPHGVVMDVLLDLRNGSSYGKVASAELSEGNGHIVFIPKGIAHGFLALTNEAIMLYKTSTVHAPQADCGIQWDSFGFDWGQSDPIVSTRDQQHISFANFKSPF